MLPPDSDVLWVLDELANDYGVFVCVVTVGRVRLVEPGGLFLLALGFTGLSL